MKPSAPVEIDIVLLGAGHAHVQVMRAFGMDRPRGVRLTIVTDRLEAPYSGMLPGCIAGDYPSDAMHIDVVRLARHTGCRLVHAEAIGLDRRKRTVELRGRPPLAYDLLSIDVGITPDLSAIEGAEEHAVPVKPIAGFLRRMSETERALGALPQQVAVIGGGPAGIELAFAFHDRWPMAGVTLLAGGGLAPSLNASVRKRVREALKKAGIAMIEGDPSHSIVAGEVQTEGGRTVPANAIFVSTAAKPAAWIAAADLPKAKNGGIAIRQTLQVLDDDRIFAAGDCATMVEDPRPRAGVFAVRQGPILARNLMAAARGEQLETYRPQKEFLAILRTGRGRAIAARGWLPAVEGRWVWRWKDRIDRAFMERFTVPETDPADENEIMRCGGCAAKVGPDPLAAALSRLPDAIASPAIVQGLERPDDAAILRFDGGPMLAQTVDQIRAFIDDPYLFGRIAANHALNDVYAMGGQPHHALAIATLPYGRSGKVADDLHQLLAGARATLDDAGCALVGGHSAEGEAMALGLAVTGRLEAPPLTKRGARSGDQLILTKPLGSGIIFAADMRASAPAAIVGSMLRAMLVSNAEAARILRMQGATAMTDVSGFGLLGHLGEMLSDGIGATVELASVPLAPGAMALVQRGHSSSLLDENLSLLRHLSEPTACPAPWRTLLLDPQTSGGLLAAIPAERADAAIAALAQAGYADASKIGFVKMRRGVGLT